MKNFVSDILNKDGKLPSLTVVFENLNYYPVLVLLGAILKILIHSPDTLSLISFWFLFPVFAFLLLAVMAQTSFLLIDLAIGISSYIISNALNLKQVANKKWFVFLFGIIFIVISCLSVTSIYAVFNVLTHLQSS
jgi:hypothetical protein